MAILPSKSILKLENHPPEFVHPFLGKGALCMRCWDQTELQGFLSYRTLRSHPRRTEKGAEFPRACLLWSHSHMPQDSYALLVYILKTFPAVLFGTLKTPGSRINCFLFMRLHFIYISGSLGISVGSTGQ